jgi:hypothetical protein
LLLSPSATTDAAKPYSVYARKLDALSGNRIRSSFFLARSIRAVEKSHPSGILSGTDRGKRGHSIDLIVVVSVLYGG